MGSGEQFDEGVTALIDEPDRGLTATEAEVRLRRDGPNTLPVQRPPPAWRLFVRQFVHFFALMLWAASILAYIGNLPELSLAIVVVIVVNGIFAFVQEYRAERAASRLLELLPQQVTVRRDGKVNEIDASQLVVDDVVIFNSGDRISADLRVIQSESMMTDTSTFTGESMPRSTEAGEKVFAGTFVVEGEGVGVVEATGSDTRLAEITRLVQAGQRPESPLTREVNHLVRVVAIIAVSVGAVFFLVSVLIGTDPLIGILFAIGVTVALVPEGLLPSVTMSLAVGAKRLADQQALVRRLESVETLGSTTYICTDKTGTLTQNRMAVVEAWTPSGRAHIKGVGYEPHGTIEAEQSVIAELQDVGTIVARCASGDAVLRDEEWVPRGDPMEVALTVFGRRLGIDIQFT